MFLIRLPLKSSKSGDVVGNKFIVISMLCNAMACIVKQQLSNDVYARVCIRHNDMMMLKTKSGAVVCVNHVHVILVS